MISEYLKLFLDPRDIVAAEVKASTSTSWSGVCILKGGIKRNESVVCHVTMRAMKKTQAP